MSRTKLTKAYYEWLGPTTHAITFVYNRNHVSLTKGGETLREFHRRVDQERLGGKFYREPPEKRLRFLVTAEKWETHPHCHGLIRLREDELADTGLEAIERTYNEIWQEICPGGSIKIRPITDELGWANYASKEHDLFDGSLALDSLMQNPREPWTLQLATIKRRD